MYHYKITKNGKELDSGDVVHNGLAGEAFDEQIFTKAGAERKDAQGMGVYGPWAGTKGSRSYTVTKGSYEMVVSEI